MHLKQILKLSVSIMALIVSLASGLAGPNEAVKSATHITNNTRASWHVDRLPRWFGAADTNGLACELIISNVDTNRIRSDGRHYEAPEPVCLIYVTNQTTHVFETWAHYLTNYTSIELLDEAGKPVERTAEGKKYGIVPNETGLRQMFKERYALWRKGRFRTTGFKMLGRDISPFGEIGIPELFELKQPGEYSLKVEMCLILRLSESRPDPEIQVIRLLPVAAKMHIERASLGP